MHQISAENSSWLVERKISISSVKFSGGGYPLQLYRHLVSPPDTTEVTGG
jgi:hypothetical protein